MDIRYVFSAGLAAVLCGCGGSGSSGPPPVGTPQPAPPTIFGGFWSGEVVIEAAQGSEDCIALMTEDGQFRFLCPFSSLYLVGMSSRDGTAVDGSGLALSSLQFLNGEYAVSLSLQGTLLEAESFSGFWTTDSAGDAGSFDMLYDGEYERMSSLQLLAGDWAGFDIDGNEVSGFSIDALGSFTARNANGCNSAGTFSIIDGRYNLYQVDSTISDCPIAGVYSGLALVTATTEPDDTVLLTIDDGERALLAILIR